MSTIETPLDLDAFARINGTANVLRELGGLIGDATSTPHGKGTLAERVYVDYFEDLIRTRWGEDYEEVAEFHEAEARAHDEAAALLRFLARDLDKQAAYYEEQAQIDRTLAEGCSR